ncbi:MAG: UbiA family prenyltransferase [Planctomycetota bacterium]
MKAWLRLARVPFAFTAATDALAVGLLAHAALGSDAASTRWPAVLGAAVLVYAFGMMLNDWADRAEDALVAPRRPLPSGALRPAPVAVAILLVALGALGLGHVAGTLPGVGAALGLAALYDLGAKRSVRGGAVVLGLARAANAAQVPLAAALAGAVSSPALLAALAIGTYAAAITVHSAQAEVGVRHTVLVRSLVGVAFAGAAILAWVVAGTFTLATMFASMLAFGVASSTAFGRTPRTGPIPKQVREMLCGLYMLAYVVASPALGSNALLALGGLFLAWGLAIASQLFVRALGT